MNKLNSLAEKIIKRSQPYRQTYLSRMKKDAESIPLRKKLACSNLAHAYAACSQEDKQRIKLTNSVNIGIITSFNDMLSAHQPFEIFPNIIKQAARDIGSTAQVAGATSAMCDGVTQGEIGMELSLFSRDQIAMSVGVALSHRVFDAAIYLGMCDKIVPGLVMGALRFGYLPSILAPAGPMTTGISNDEKQQVRKAFATGDASREELLESESNAYHGPGICTFYGTANTNQVLMEFMGLHLPNSSFANPGTDLRTGLTKEAVYQLSRISKNSGQYTPICEVVSEKSIINAVVGLLATGGSTNMTIHLVAIARAAGIILTWDDISELSKIIPLMARIYPNGKADINHFYASGGVAYLINELLEAGLLFDDVKTVVGSSLSDYTKEPFVVYNAGEPEIEYRKGSCNSLDSSILSTAKKPFMKEGGIRLLQGNLGRAVTKISAVPEGKTRVEAPAKIFECQEDFETAFKAGDLNQDCVVVLRFKGPSMNGMPEYHGLIPGLSVLQDRGYNVALVTDGRLSGASGKIPSAIHVCPEAGKGGPLALLKENDIVLVDCKEGILNVEVAETEWSQRTPQKAPYLDGFGAGREMFLHMKSIVNGADEGATVFRFECDQ